eukprot:NODE_3693_length_933_cov_34.184389_g3394_i0.p1 GENE.NODE_3693_length_933_cov_34.184389_g3394_i0~~NODE_3693_length_933_cov_34.184389_g3394_i0.p1  ORF type:complete len:239 (+),score=46.60 NODE_3693_length_933_cov_34.184389_g3394_i0:140-856(+)
MSAPTTNLDSGVEEEVDAEDEEDDEELSPRVLGSSMLSNDREDTDRLSNERGRTVLPSESERAEADRVHLLEAHCLLAAKRLREVGNECWNLEVKAASILDELRKSQEANAVLRRENESLRRQNDLLRQQRSPCPSASPVRPEESSFSAIPFDLEATPPPLRPRSVETTSTNELELMPNSSPSTIASQSPPLLLHSPVDGCSNDTARWARVESLLSQHTRRLESERGRLEMIIAELSC